MLEVIDSLHPDVVLFSTGENEGEENICGLKVQSLDTLLESSPTLPPHYKPQKDFNGKATYGVRV